MNIFNTCHIPCVFDKDHWKCYLKEQSENTTDSEIFLFNYYQQHPKTMIVPVKCCIPNYFKEYFIKQKIKNANPTNVRFVDMGAEGAK